MAQRKTLTQQQVALLRWIADGCSDGEMEGYSYRVSAAALRSRGLVTTKGRGATWAAQLTLAGQEYLAEVDGPSPPIPRQANVSVTEQEAGADRSGRVAWSGSRDGHFVVDAQGHSFVLRVREKGVRTRGPWEEEVHHYRNVPRGSNLYRDRELPSGPYDAEATGQLDLELDRHWSLKGRQARWGDRQNWKLEERLPHLFREIEERIIELERIGEERRLATERAAEKARREAEEREQTWRALMREAEARAADERRVAHLRSQADAWEEADRLRRYCRAMEEAYGDHPATGAWIEWVRDHAATLDPLREAPTEPDPVESTPEELQRHLPAGWRVEGPTHHRYY
jgi:hypothetical protein